MKITINIMIEYTSNLIALPIRHAASRIKIATAILIPLNAAAIKGKESKSRKK